MKQMKSLDNFYTELKNEIPELSFQKLWNSIKDCHFVLDVEGTRSICDSLIHKVFKIKSGDSLTQLYLNDVRDLMHALVDIGNQKQWEISKNEKSFSIVGGGILPFESVWLSADTCADIQAQFLSGYKKYKLLSEFYSKLDSVAFLYLNKRDYAYAVHVTQKILSPKVRTKLHQETPINEVSESTVILLIDGKGIVLRNSTDVPLKQFSYSMNFLAEMPFLYNEQSSLSDKVIKRNYHDYLRIDEDEISTLF